MAALKRQVADREMGFNESEIRRKMDEIADWLNDQSSPPPDASLPPRRPAEMPETDSSSLESIVANRLAARRRRETDDRSTLRSTLERFPGPLTRQAASPRGPLSSAVAEIMERQRELDDYSEPRVMHRAAPEPRRAVPAPRHDDRYADALHDRGAEMEATFERFVARFEARAEQTFQTLESSLGEVRRLLDEAKTPVEAAEAAAAYIVQTRLHDLEAGTNARIEEVARGLAELRIETSESERRTRDLLDAVRSTLEHVASRLPERHGQRPVAAMPFSTPANPVAPPAGAPAAEAEPNITVRVREAARRAMEESAEEEPLDLGPRINATVPDRRRFIAAARRSTQDGERDPVLNYRTAGTHAPRAQPLPEAQAAAAKPKKGGAIKRILLAGTAAAVLVLGIYAGSSRLLDNLLSSQDVAVSEPDISESTAADTVAPKAVPMIAPTSSSALLSTQPVSGASTFTETEPVITGSISLPPPPSVPLAALPVAIGGENLRRMAESGDAAAAHEIGMRFAEGHGVERDQMLAAQWLKRAADQGLAPAQYRLASMIEKGMGVAKDIPAARDLYEKAAEAGNVQAMHNLGVLYAEGGLGEPDLGTAFQWFRKAAEYGVKDSQYNLGIFYAKGLATAQDFAQSYLWFALAAAQGDKDATAKRDQIAAKLDANRVTALRITADTWKPKTAQPEANTVAAPAQGWDAPASGKTSMTRLSKAN